MELLFVLGGGWVIAMGSIAISVWMLIHGIAVVLSGVTHKE